MEKLELKHLALYFPYELCAVVPDEIGACLIVAMNEQSLYIDSGCDYPFEEIKPILRLLSSITDIELEQFGYDEETLELLIFGYDCPIGLWNELLEKHFDVFGLIKKGLAVDINTL